MSEKTRNLTQDQIDEIVARKLDRESVRSIAKAVGCTYTTVQRHWHAWLDATSEDRRDQLERQRSETIRKLEHVADTARRDSLKPDISPDQVAKFLNVERQALGELARIAGHVSPQRIEVTGGLQLPTDAEARQVLAELGEL